MRPHQGGALGNSVAEATVHSLLELAERDAFLISWHRAAPLPAIDPATLRDPVTRQLLALVADRGFDTYLLTATADIDIPVVWALAVNRTGAFPASYSTAGSSVDPGRAVRGALWELAHQVAQPVRWDRAGIAPMLDDPWRVDVMEDHCRFYTLPETLPRVTAVLGGPVVTLDEAFPGWPHRVVAAAGGDVCGTLEYLAELYRRAGLDRIVVVDQSTRDHRDLGLHVVKAVVPGIVPMCFGQAQQRLVGLDRLRRVVPTSGATRRDVPYDPHPFP